MRSLRELKFRLRQEAVNALLVLSSPNLNLNADAPLAPLPNPIVVAGVLRNTDYADRLFKSADEIVQGRVPIFDKLIDYGPVIPWRTTRMGTFPAIRSGPGFKPAPTSEAPNAITTSVAQTSLPLVFVPAITGQILRTPQGWARGRTAAQKHHASAVIVRSAPPAS